MRPSHTPTATFVVVNEQFGHCAVHLGKNLGEPDEQNTNVSTVRKDFLSAAKTCVNQKVLGQGTPTKVNSSDVDPCKHDTKKPTQTPNFRRALITDAKFPRSDSVVMTLAVTTALPTDVCVYIKDCEGRLPGIAVHEDHSSNQTNHGRAPQERCDARPSSRQNHTRTSKPS